MVVDWDSFLAGVMLGIMVMLALASIAINVSDVRDILKELACCEALKRMKERGEG